MKPLWVFAAATLALSTAAPASAALVEYQYAGIIGVLSDPAHAGGVNVGDLVDVRLRFDTANLVDVTEVAKATYGVAYDDLKAASLSAPGAALRLSSGAHHFTEADEFDFFGDPFGLGGPYVLFNNGKFFGIQFFGLNPEKAGFATAGASPQPFDFAGGDFLPGGGPSYAGYFDYGSLKVRGVPEPASWALMICGFAAAGAVLRRRRAVVA
jgi:hypothetical protein